MFVDVELERTDVVLDAESRGCVEANVFSIEAVDVAPVAHGDGRENPAAVAGDHENVAAELAFDLAEKLEKPARADRMIEDHRVDLLGAWTVCPPDRREHDVGDRRVQNLETLVSRRSQGGKPTIYLRLGSRSQGLHAIGRLDYDSEGLLLLTDDGTLAEALLHPRSEVLRRYRVWVTPVPESDRMRRLAAGAVVEGVAVAPETVELEGIENGLGILRIDLREGKKREIREFARSAGLNVRRLLRISFGPVQLGILRRGAVRPLTSAELGALRRLAVPRGARLPRQGPR